MSNGRLGLVLVGVAFAMISASYASVPLYRLFCQVTGYAGTPVRGEITDRTVGKELVTIRFNADLSSRLPWEFRPALPSQQVRPGEDNLAFFVAVNNSDEAMVGTATFNVTPNKAAQYFVKTDCFCFTEQRLEPGERAEMPVSFYVDPDLYTDKNTRDVTTITLSYTFFSLDDEETAEVLAGR